MIACASSAVSSPVSERQVGLLQREPVDVAVEHGERVRRPLDREAALPEATDHRVVMSQRCGPGCCAGLQ